MDLKVLVHNGGILH